MSQLVDFYRGAAPDSEGRRLAEMWDWDDDRLEERHDFIQWMFPLPEPSQFNPRAPLLTAEDRAAFRTDMALQANLHRSFARILSFLGFAQAPDGRVVEGENFAARAPDVWSAPNHNFLRISRILRSLALLGLQEEAQALYERLQEMFNRRKYPIPADSFRYWTAAVTSGPAEG
jgi:hypothetical protein